MPSSPIEDAHDTLDGVRVADTTTGKAFTIRPAADGQLRLVADVGDDERYTPTSLERTYLDGHVYCPDGESDRLERGLDALTGGRRATVERAEDGGLLIADGGTDMGGMGQCDWPGCTNTAVARVAIPRIVGDGVSRDDPLCHEHAGEYRSVDAATDRGWMEPHHLAPLLVIVAFVVMALGTLLVYGVVP